MRPTTGGVGWGGEECVFVRCHLQWVVEAVAGPVQDPDVQLLQQHRPVVDGKQRGGGVEVHSD
jgi:hypothetical protein